MDWMHFVTYNLIYLHLWVCIRIIIIFGIILFINVSLNCFVIVIVLFRVLNFIGWKILILAVIIYLLLQEITNLFYHFLFRDDHQYCYSAKFIYFHYLSTLLACKFAWFFVHILYITLNYVIHRQQLILLIDLHYTHNLISWKYFNFRQIFFSGKKTFLNFFYFGLSLHWCLQKNFFTFTFCIDCNNLNIGHFLSLKKKLLDNLIEKILEIHGLFEDALMLK